MSNKWVVAEDLPEGLKELHRTGDYEEACRIADEENSKVTNQDSYGVGVYLQEVFDGAIPDEWYPEVIYTTPSGTKYDR